MIVITGANGFIGSAMVWELNSRGIKNIVAVDSVPLTERNLLRKRQYDRFLLKDELWDYLESPQGEDITWIIHMGACSTTTETDWNFLKENNVEYTQRIFKWCARENKNLIFASSAATYGAGEKGFDDATDPETLKPLNLYGESKVLVDRWIARQENRPPHWYGLKFFNVFGPNEHEKGPMASVAFKAFNEIRKTGQLKLFRSHDPKYKDGEQLRDFVYVKDVTRWMAELMEKKPASGIYNMGFGTARTWLDLANPVFSALGKAAKFEWIDIPENIRNQYQYFTEAKMDRWKALGMSAPQWPVDKAVTDYVKNHLLAEDPLL